MKNKRIKRNSQEWFDTEISEKPLIRDKPYQKHRKTRLYVDKEIYKRARYSVQTQRVYICKPKDLWKAIKSFGLPHNNLVDV